VGQFVANPTLRLIHAYREAWTSRIGEAHPERIIVGCRSPEYPLTSSAQLRRGHRGSKEQQIGTAVTRRG